MTCGIYNNGILISLTKEGNSNIGYKLDELGRHYTKWNKTVAEEHILYDCFYLYNVPRVVKFIRTENRMEVPRDWGDGGIGSCCWIGTEFSLERYLGKISLMDGGDDRTTMWVYLMPLICTLKWSKWYIWCYVYFATKKKVPSPKLETTKMPINIQMDKLWYTHTTEYNTTTMRQHG